MALFQPTNVIPSTLSGAGNGVVDVQEPFTVSWQVNGNSPLVAYQIKIMQNDTASTLKKDTGKVTLDSPFYGTNTQGEPVIFTAGVDLTGSGMVNGYANGYKLLITQWWTDDDYIEQTSASYFITRRTPTARMKPLSGGATAFFFQEYLFTAWFTQNNGDTWDWGRWELQAMQDGEYVTVEDTGPIYGAGQRFDNTLTDFYYYRNGFAVTVDENDDVVPTPHRIRCTGQTENGVLCDTGWTEFTVYFSTVHRKKPLILCPQKDTDAIKVEMPKNFPIEGTANGPYSYTVQNFYEYLTLPAGSTVAFGGEEESLDIGPNEDYSVRIKMSLTDTSAEFVPLSLDYGTYTVDFKCGPNGFAVEKDGNTLWSVENETVADSFFEIELGSDFVHWGVNVSGEVTAEKYDILPWVDKATMQGLTIGGPGIVRFVEIAKPLTFTTFSADMQSPYSYYISVLYPPLFSGMFSGTLYTGQIFGEGTLGGPTKSIGIYRKASDEPVFKLIANVPFNKRYFMDYSALNRKTYEYFLLLLHTDGWTNLLGVQDRYSTTSITPCWWNYTVLCCSQDANKDYIVEKEYRFALNVESGAVSNNNKPTIQQNFTRYPIRQPVIYQYRSGTLSALIGKVQDGDYVDSAKLMDELYALSTSRLTKFLKTRKGQLIQIETGSPIIMQISDKYAEQPVKIQLPWVEVGDASNANILGESTAFSMPQFSVDTEDMEANVTYRDASPYDLNSFVLAGGSLVVNDPGPYPASAYSLVDGNVMLNTEQEG